MNEDKKLYDWAREELRLSPHEFRSAVALVVAYRMFEVPITGKAIAEILDLNTAHPPMSLIEKKGLAIRCLTKGGACGLQALWVPTPRLFRAFPELPPDELPSVVRCRAPRLRLVERQAG